MSEHTSTIFEESWQGQIRKARLIMVGIALFGAVVVWAGLAQDATETGGRIAIVVIGGLFGLFGLGGLFFLRDASDTGLRIDQTGITVRLAKGPVAFQWDELDAVSFEVITTVRPGSGPEKLRTSTNLALHLAPVDQFADRPRLPALSLPDALPYTHRIKIISTGPLASSEDRIGQLDAALGALAGPKYAGLNRNG